MDHCCNGSQFCAEYHLSAQVPYHQLCNHDQYMICFHIQYYDQFDVTYSPQFCSSQLDRVCQTTYLFQKMKHLERLEELCGSYSK